MFSALYQDALPEVRAFPAGLRVIHPTGAAEPLLVVKISKEGILAARLARGFKIYVCPSAVLGGQTVGLITAFFDTPDEPLVLRSPMFDDEHSRKLSALLQTDSFDVHFFDEHSRELLAHKVAVSAPERTRNELLSEVLTAFSYQTAGESLDRMAHWFGMRTVDDDALAMELTFVETLMPEDVYLIDLIPENNAFSGARSFHTSQLIREEPGAFQEHDIALLLMRVFPAEQIFKSPLKVRDGEEVSDLLVITSENVIFVQAKDSPNTREVLNNSLQRKMATTLKSLKKAIGQVRGALRYAKSAEPMSMLVGCKLMAAGAGVARRESG